MMKILAFVFLLAMSGVALTVNISTKKWVDDSINQRQAFNRWRNRENR